MNMNTVKVLPIDIDSEGNEDALKELAPELEQKLCAIEDEMILDPKHTAPILRGHDDGIKSSMHLWTLFLTPLYVVLTIAALAVRYTFAVKDAYDRLKLKQIVSEDFVIPSFSSWLFKGCQESGSYYRSIGPITWSIIFLVVLLPVILIRGFGESYLKTWHYHALKKDLAAIKNRTGMNISDTARNSGYRASLEAMRVEEGYQAHCVLFGTISAAFLATNFAEALLNLLAMHYLAECDENAMRNLLIRRYTLTSSLKRPDLTKQEYEEIWCLNRTNVRNLPAGNEHATQA